MCAVFVKLFLEVLATTNFSVSFPDPPIRGVVLHGSYLFLLTNKTINGQNFISVIFPAKSDFSQLLMPRYAMLD